MAQTNTNPTTMNPVTALAREIAETIGKAMADINRAAAIYAQGLDQHGQALADKLTEMAPAVPRLFWRRLEMIGRNQLDARLLHGDTPAAQRLRKLPYSEQRSALDTGVELLLNEDDTMLVQVENLTPFQARQAFDGDHIRTLPEQRAWLETERAKQSAPQPYSEPFSIRRDKVEIHRPVTLTRRDLARMLEELA